MQRGRGHAIDLLFEGLSEGLRGRPGVGVRHLAAYRETADVLARGNNWTAMMRWLRVLGNRQWGMGSLIMGEMGVTACTTVWDGTSVPRRTRRIALEPGCVSISTRGKGSQGAPAAGVEEVIQSQSPSSSQSRICPSQPRPQYPHPGKMRPIAVTQYDAISTARSPKSRLPD